MLKLIGHMIYMGKDKFENEELIRFGWPEDCIYFYIFLLIQN